MIAIVFVSTTGLCHFLFHHRPRFGFPRRRRGCHGHRGGVLDRKHSTSRTFLCCSKDFQLTLYLDVLSLRLQQEIPDEEADNITTVQQAIDYIAKSPEGKLQFIVP